MDNFTEESSAKSEKLLETIMQKVEERENKETSNNLAISIHKQTEHIISFIESLKDSMITTTGGYRVNSTIPKDMKSTTASNLFINTDGSNTLLSDSLIVMLDEHINFLNDAYLQIQSSDSSQHSQVLPHFHSMTLDGNEDPLFMTDSEQSKRSWTQLAFDHTPLIASLAFFTEKQAKISSYEANLLSLIKNKVDGVDFKQTVSSSDSLY